MPQDFFDFREKLPAGRIPRRAPDPKGNALTVSQLTAMIDGAIRARFPSSVLVRGEISNVNHHKASGHLYFTLKDAHSCIGCVMWKSDLARLKFKPVAGTELIAGGRVEVYAARGQYQLYVTSLNPIGKGALELAFQQLREKLEREGLFARERKKPLPSFPRDIVVVTSRNTAALQDVLKVWRMFPFLRISLFHVPVQGDGSAELIAGALQMLSREAANGRPVDIIMLARGGGSLEDLWEFNEEIVARAIARSAIPVVTGIGHEVDVSIADLVADYHAHTPTEAAQVVVKRWRTARDDLAVIGVRLRRELRQILGDCRHRLLAIERHDVIRRPTARVNMLRQRLDDQQRALTLAQMRRIKRAESRLAPLQAMMIKCHPKNEIARRRDGLDWMQTELTRGVANIRLRAAAKIESVQRTLDALSPQHVLGRGYSITRLKRGGKIVHLTGDVKPGETLETQLKDGTIESTVQDQRQGRLFER